jgi:flagellin
MRIQNYLPTIRAARLADQQNNRVERAIKHLAAGLRVQSGADDAAGLAISERMRATVRGLNQAGRNIQDGISLVRTADAALEEIQSLLHRGRELAIQAANGTLTDRERNMLNDEWRQLHAEINRIATTTSFNGRPLLNQFDPPGPWMGKEQVVVDALRKSWLKDAEDLIWNAYGLRADEVPLKIVLEPSGPYDMYLLSVPEPSGQWGQIELHINLSTVSNAILPDGQMTSGLYMDRRIAHVLTHAVMMRTTNYNTLPGWFEEGTAEFIMGGDERLAAALASTGGPAGLVSLLSGPWFSTSDQWAAGYAAVKYLHQRSLQLGHDGIREVVNYMRNGADLSKAIAAATGGFYASEAAFLADFQGANGQSFVASLDVTDADVGSFFGGDAHSVVNNSNADEWDPMEGFEVDWGKPWRPQAPIRLQVGERAGDQLDLPSIGATTTQLGVRRVNLVYNPQKAIQRIDGAIERVSQFRAQLGATQNRLESAANVTAIQAENQTAAESRIRDLDMAQGMADLVKGQVLQQAAVAMEAQAVLVRRQAVADLLGSR